MNISSGLDEVSAAPRRLPSYTMPKADATVPEVMMLATADLRRAAMNRPNGSGLDEKSLGELADSVRAKGILQPLLVRPNGSGYEIIAGERRWRAAKLVKLETVPCLVRDVGDVEAAELRAIENLQREDLLEIEEAKGFRELLDLRDAAGKPVHTAETLAQRVGKSEAHIYGRLKLLRLPQVAVAAMLDGKLPASTAELIGRIPDAGLREKAAIEILTNSYEVKVKELSEFREEALDLDNVPMSFREAKEHLQENYMSRLKGCGFDQADADLVPVEFAGGERVAGGACTDCPQLSGNRIDPESVKGSADVCMNPACLARKKSAQFRRDAAKAKEDGQTLLPEGKAKSLFWDGTLRSYGAATKYVDLKAPVDRGSKQTWAQALQGVAVPTFLAADERKHVHSLVLVSAAAEALQAAGKKVPATLAAKARAQEQKARPTNPEEEKRKREREELDRKREELINSAIYQALAEKGKGMEAGKVLRLLAERTEDCWDLREWDWFQKLQKGLKSVGDCQAYLLVCQLSTDYCAYDRQQGVDRDLAKIGTAMGLNVQNVVDALESQFKREDDLAAAKAKGNGATPKKKALAARA